MEKYSEWPESEKENAREDWKVVGENIFKAANMELYSRS